MWKNEPVLVCQIQIENAASITYQTLLLALLLVKLHHEYGMVSLYLCVYSDPMFDKD